MSKATFDASDRADPHSASADGRDDRIRLMARSGGYVMVRKPRCTPFVLSEKDWGKLPRFTPSHQRDHPPPVEI
jgi:hypothetical protein